MPIQIIDDGGNIYTITGREASMITQALDNGVINQIFQIPPTANSEDYYNQVIDLKTRIAPYATTD